MTLAYPRLCPMRNDIRGYTLLELGEINFNEIIQQITSKQGNNNNKPLKLGLAFRFATIHYLRCLVSNNNQKIMRHLRNRT